MELLEGRLLLSAAPEIGFLLADPDPLVLGETLTLTAYEVVADDDEVATVQFYRDSDGDGVLDPDADETWPWTSRTETNWTWTGPTADFDVGINRFFVRALDDDGRWSQPAGTTITIVATAAPSVGALSAGSAVVRVGDTLILLASDVTDDDGAVVNVEFYHDGNDNGVLDVGADPRWAWSSRNNVGWTWVGSTAGFSTGINRFFARARDNHGNWSAPADTTVTVVPNAAPTIGSLVLGADPVELGDPLTLSAVGVDDADGHVDRVEFFDDLNFDGIGQPTEKLGQDTDDDDGWQWVGPAEGPTDSHTYLARAVDNDGDVSGWVDEAGTVFSAAREVGVGLRTRSVSYTDGDRTRVRIHLSGGTAQLRFVGRYLQQIGQTGHIRIEGLQVELAEISLTGTNPHSRMITSARGGRVRGATVGAITGDAPLRGLFGRKLDLVGEGVHLTGDGYIRALRLGDVVNGADVVMPGVVNRGGLSIVAGRIDVGTRMVLASPVKRLIAAEWLDANDDGPADLSAPSIGRLKMKGRGGVDRLAGDFQADVVTHTIARLTVRGMLRGSQIHATGDIGHVKAAAIFDSTVFAGTFVFADDDGPGGQADGVPDLPNPGVFLGGQDDQGGRPGIKSVIVTGKRKSADGYALGNSNIAAAEIGTVLVRFASPNEGVPFGLSADNVRELTLQNYGPGQRWGWKRLHDEQDWQAPDGVEDLVVRLV